MSKTQIETGVDVDRDKRKAPFPKTRKANLTKMMDTNSSKSLNHFSTQFSYDDRTNHNMFEESSNHRGETWLRKY